MKLKHNSIDVRATDYRLKHKDELKTKQKNYEIEIKK